MTGKYNPRALVVGVSTGGFVIVYIPSTAQEKKMPKSSVGAVTPDGIVELYKIPAFPKRYISGKEKR